MKQKLGDLLSNSRSRMILTVVIVAVIVTITIGVGSTLAANDQETKTLAISEKAAKEIAMNKTDGGILESFKMDFDDGKQVFEVDIIKGNYEYDIKIDAATGEIIAFDQEKIKAAATNQPAADTGSSSGQQNTDSNTGNGSGSNGSSSGSDSTKNSGNDTGSNYIGKAKAKSIALNKSGGGKVVHCYLDYDDGRAEYDVKIFNGKYEYELEICAKTGRILDYDRDLQDKYEHDDDDDHYDDDDDHDDHYDD